MVSMLFASEVASKVSEGSKVFLHLGSLTITQEAVALAIFLVVYALIIFEEKIVHRSIVALLGGMLVIILGLITPKEGWSFIEQNTIFLLMGMMMIVAMLTQVGFFKEMAKLALRFTGPNPRKILIVFASLTAILSMFLDNVTTVLFMVPIMITIAQALELNPIPYLITLVLFSNIGGTATLVGDPPNIIIGSIGGYSFVDFMINMTPPVVFSGLVTLLVIYLFSLWRPEVFGIKKSYDHISLESLDLGTEEETLIPPDKRPLAFNITVTMFLLTIVGFFLGHYIHVEAGVIALFMSSLLLGILAFVVKLDHKKIILDVEWPTLLFFIGLFIIVGTLDAKGVLKDVAKALASYISMNAFKNIMVIGWFSAIVSGIVDNIPFTMAMAMILKDISIVGLPHIPHPDPKFFAHHLWWALSLGACYGGNFTLIGASANVVTADIASKKGYKITFAEFLKWGVPLTFISTAVGLSFLYMWLKIIKIAHF